MSLRQSTKRQPFRSNAGGFGQEPIIDSKGSWAVGKFQVIDDLEIFLIDADDILPDGSVPGFVVLLAPLQPSSCGFSVSRWVDILVPRVVMGAPLVISLCCVLCRLLPRELLQGFWCRHDHRDVPWVCDSPPCALGVS